MNDDQFATAWTTLQPSARQRQRLDARVHEWLDAHDTPLVTEWLALFRIAPFAATALVAVSAVALATAPPVIWFASALL